MAYFIGRTLFLHIPKTGGKAVLSAFESAGVDPRPCQAPGHHVGHAGTGEIKESRYRWGFVWAIIREPVEWWSSLWKFSETPGSKLYDIDPDIGHPFRPILPFCRRGLSLSDFVGRIVERRPGFYSDMVDRYLGEDDKNVDFVGRTDELGRSIRQAIRLGGIRIGDGFDRFVDEPEIVNRSEPTDPSLAVWEPSLLAEVKTYEDRTLRRFWGGGEYTGSRGGTECRDI